MSFADNLQYLRKKNKITQEELAEELGVSRQSVSKWETGEAYPETEKLISLCDKFGVTLDELLRGNVVKEDEESEDEDTSHEEEDGEESEDDEEEFRQSASDCCACAEGHNKPSALSQRLCALTMLLSIILYVCLGITLDLWHPGWLIFLGAIVIFIWIGCLSDKGKTLKERVGGAVCGSTMIIAVIAYLSVGFTLNIWHPTWVVFVVGCGICAVVGAFTGKKQ